MATAPHEAPHPVWPEPVGRSPFTVEEMPVHEPCAFDAPKLDSAEDVPEALRGWVMGALVTIEELVSPGARMAETPTESAINGILCDVERLLDDAADVLEGKQPKPWKPVRDRSNLHEAARELAGRAGERAGDSGLTMLALQSLLKKPGTREGAR